MADLLYGWSSSSLLVAAFAHPRDRAANMRPVLSRNDGPEGRLNQSVLSSQDALSNAPSGVPSPNLDHDVSRQFRGVDCLATASQRRIDPQWMFVASRRPANSTPSGVHVSGVIQRSASVQMVRPHARRIVAVVKHPEALWDGAIVDGPRIPVGVHKHGFVGAELSVPPPTFRCSPHPAFGQFGTHGRTVFVDLGPETNRCRRTAAWSAIVVDRFPTAAIGVTGAVAIVGASVTCLVRSDRHIAPTMGALDDGMMTMHRDDLLVSRGAEPPDVSASRRHFDAMIIPSSLGGNHG